jgi:hypothetical protein
MSPVDICGMAYFWQMKVACVPLPAPGAPNKISLMDILDFYEFFDTPGSCLRSEVAWNSWMSPSLLSSRG